MSDKFSYTFGCPFCEAVWTLEQFITAAKDIFRVGNWEGEGECPACGRQFVWRRAGELKDKSRLRRKRKYPSHPCKWCGRMLDGNRRFCNTQCNKKWYYRQKHPEVKRKTPVISA